MNILTIFLFFVYMWGFGYSLTFFKKKHPEKFEKFFMDVGIGIGVFIVFGVFLNFLRLSLDWKIFLPSCLIIPFYSFYINLKKKGFKFSIPSRFILTKEVLNVFLVLLMFFFTMFMYTRGSFNYPWMEDSDPWNHVVGASYVKYLKTAYDTQYYNVKYMDAYQPGYDIILGILHQTSPKVNWTVKFFNSLLLSLTVIFLYYFVKKLTDNRALALAATFIFTMIPCTNSHFIWAHSVVPLLIIVALYTLLNIRDDPKYLYASAFTIAGSLLVQPTQAIKLGVILAGFIILEFFISKRSFKYSLLAALGGSLTSVVVWWIPMFIKYNGFMGLVTEGARVKAGGNFSVLASTGISGTATRAYNFADFFIAKAENQINNPIGVGIIISLLLFVGLMTLLIFSKDTVKSKRWTLFSLFFLVFTFYGLHGGTRWWAPYALFSFRFWMLFAIPVSIFAAEGFVFLLSIFKKNKFLQFLMILVIISGVFFTSGYQKYRINTSIWLPSWFVSMEEVNAYSWLNTLPINTKVYDLADPRRPLAYDKFACIWCKDEVDFLKYIKNKSVNKSVIDIYSFLSKNRYEYVILSATFANDFGEKETQALLEDISKSGKYVAAVQKPGFLALRVIT